MFSLLDAPVKLSPCRTAVRATCPFRAVPLLVISLITSVSIAGQPASGEQHPGGVDWVLVVDTSASMRGVGGTQNIFASVKSAVEEFITNARQGDSVTIYAFDRDTTRHPTVPISDETDKRDLKNTIRDLQANGNRTHTGKAIADALRRAAELGERKDAANRQVAIVLLTDGLEDVRGIPRSDQDTGHRVAYTGKQALHVFRFPRRPERNHYRGRIRW